MTLRLLLLFYLCLNIASCNKTQQQSAEVAVSTTKEKIRFTETDLKTLDYTEFSLDSKVKSQISDWVGYFTLATIIEDLKIPDFSFFENNDVPIEDLIIETHDTLPEKFSTQAILSRITIIESMLYKTKEIIEIHANDRAQLLIAVKDLSEAFSNLNFQLNKKIEKDAQNIERPN